MTVRPRFGFALSYVKDVEAARGFYEGVLGLETTRVHPVFVEFRDAAGVAFAVASDERMTETRGAEVYWVVEDAASAFDELSRQAEVTRPVTDMPFGKLFGVRDPSGNEVLVLEFARNRPSEAV